MASFNYNLKYKFISDGTWFTKGTECQVEDGTCLWGFGVEGEEISHENLLENKEKIIGMFRGDRICQNAQSEGCPVGTLRKDDGECCGLREFEIVKI